MCQRRQKSAGEVASHGCRKFTDSSIPRIRADPRAISVYPEKSASICTPNANTPTHNKVPPGSAEEKMRSTIIPMLSAITSFLKSPQAISEIPLAVRSASNLRRRSNCGSRTDARSIGPATSCGKKLTNNAVSIKLPRANVRFV